MIFGVPLTVEGAPPDTERAIPGSDLFRVGAGNRGLIAPDSASSPTRWSQPDRGTGVPRAGLPRWVINVHGRQVFHLVSGEAEMDKHGPDLRHGADRDSHVFAARHVPLLEEHVGYLAAVRFHDQPLDLPDLAVGRTDGQAAVYVYRAGWDGVDGDLRRGCRSSASAGGNPDCPPAQVKCPRGFRFAGVRGNPDFAPTQVKWLLSPWVPVPGGVEVRHGFGLLTGPERLELGQGAAKPDLAGRSVYEVHGNKPTRARPVLGVDREMSDLPGGRVDDYAA
jgi:hypothetical protein